MVTQRSYIAKGLSKACCHSPEVSQSCHHCTSPPPAANHRSGFGIIKHFASLLPAWPIRDVPMYSFMQSFFNPIWSWGAHCAPLSRICVYLCKYAYERIEKKLVFLSYEFGKRQYTFYPVTLSRFAEKIKFLGNTKISQGETLTNRVKRLFDEQKFQKSNVF